MLPGRASGPSHQPQQASEAPIPDQNLVSLCLARVMEDKGEESLADVSPAGPTEQVVRAGREGCAPWAAA